MIPNPSFWRGKRVLVTGHTGFKGSWLCLWLERLGAEVSGYALEPPTEPSLYDAARVGSTLRSRTGDVRDLETLAAFVRESRPEIVFHLAAQSLVRTGYEDPVGTFATNVLGTVHLLEAVRRRGDVGAVVVATSDKCYENREWWWSYREKSALGGRDPYSASKACTELVARSYRDSFFAAPGAGAPALATVRAGNVLGGGDWARDRLVPDVVRALTGGPPLELRYPDAVRPWQFVLEPLSGYLLLAERLMEAGPSFAEPWNFAPREEDARAVGWLADRFHRAWGLEPAWRASSEPRPHEAIYLKLDASKAKARLGWRPRLDLERTVEWVVEWYRAVAGGADPRPLTLEQIERFERMA